MSKAKKADKKVNSSLTLLDIGAFALSIWFVYSVIQNARDLIELSIKNSPASLGLILSLFIVAVSWYKRGQKFATLHIISLSVLATAVVIWLVGLSTRAPY